MPQVKQFTLEKASNWVQVWTDLKAEFQEQTLILLEGPVGAGKTTSLQYLAEILGLREVSSPTFALHQRYQNESYQLDHVDLYRMRSLDEIEDVGFWDLFSEENTLIVVEWASMIPEDQWPMHFKKIKMKLEINPSGQRTLEIKIYAPGEL